MGLGRVSQRWNATLIMSYQRVHDINTLYHLDYLVKEVVARHHYFPYPYSSLWNIGLILIAILENICSTMRSLSLSQAHLEYLQLLTHYLLQSKSQIPMHQNHTDYNMWLQHKDTKAKLQGFPGGWVVGVCLPMQEVWIPSLVWEDSTHAVEWLSPCTTQLLSLCSKSPRTATTEPTHPQNLCSITRETTTVRSRAPQP